jgi:hypothetical protein
MIIFLYLIVIILATVFSVFGVATYRVITKTDTLSKRQGTDVKVAVNEKVVAVLTRSDKKWFQKNKEVIG